MVSAPSVPLLVDALVAYDRLALSPNPVLAAGLEECQRLSEPAFVKPLASGGAAITTGSRMPTQQRPSQPCGFKQVMNPQPLRLPPGLNVVDTTSETGGHMLAGPPPGLPALTPFGGNPSLRAGGPACGVSPPGLEPQTKEAAEGDFSGKRGRAKPRHRRCQLLLATHLKDLECEEAGCIVHVRRINSLGFQSAELLEQHYSRFGPVKRVAVSNAHERAADAAFPVRLRPSGIGFVVMESQADAAAILAEGELQMVCGKEISVRKFEKREEEVSSAASDTTSCPSQSSCASIKEDETCSEKSA